MKIREIVDAIQNGIISPEAEIGMEIGFPPFKATIKVKAGDLLKFSVDPANVRNVVRRCFVQRRIFRERYSDEDRAICVLSAQEIVDALREAQKSLPSVGSNKSLNLLLGKWEDISNDARQKLQGVSSFVEILRAYRAQTLPIVDALVALLPPDDEVRKDAERKIVQLKDSLPGHEIAEIAEAWYVA